MIVGGSYSLAVLLASSSSCDFSTMMQEAMLGARGRIDEIVGIRMIHSPYEVLLSLTSP